MFSFTKLYAAVLAFSAAANAVSNLQVPVLPKSGGDITITWDADASDTESVTVALYATSPSYNGPFAIANNVNLQDKKATIPLPDVIPGQGYTVALLDMSNAKVLTQSTTFPIGVPAPESTVSTTSAPVKSYTKPVSGSRSATGSLANGTHSASGTHSANGTYSASGTHSASASASHSGSLFPSASALPSVTAPLASASSAASSALSTFASAQRSSLSSIVASAASSEAASASTSARTGAALAVRVPAAALALVAGGLFVGAWAA
ncbi:hypothetical protein B0H17DRAFT_1333302 [Mycena rosella]|uniref:Yeast cell wall synthesis Kre9/Knh1-like N-terminal domain-containing protein n=1 Tax=Mycena rosella TaxID=1033263 RepID=A0AAD7GF73_MYCRO|nr:hypothetical protein B0H17DRAFT_1333302 [Mycena rosella]